ncbi:acyl carrier protein [Pseudomonas panipatensis]|uniref:Acyl carrier protein n=1 Tax=Pseudomonas panipatensis TaxID=428992 RepID=A0A1G8LBW1_9PSED|nr:acyl carrier protein [Pseudomonas panipatensis]SDI52917.1 Acyl carrier protein [Pseudomonas panipatensis]SMP75280.1 Acyl carrier protein [Pseudomonas panipatensis]
MDEQQLRQLILRTLHSVAPEIDPEALRGDRPLREEVDLDSMDWLRFISALHQQTGIAIPESDYQRLVSIDALVAYLRERRPLA